MNLTHNEVPSGYISLPDSVPPRFIELGATSKGVTFAQARQVSDTLNTHVANLNIVSLYTQASEECGGVVQMNTKYGCLPFMLGNDGQPVLLYEFIEVLDEYFDYDRVKAEFPTLSYGQISGAIAFLRKLAQFNTRQLNIDDLEDAELEASPEFQLLIEQSLANREVARVLTAE